MQYRANKHSSGFTLTEVIVSLALVSLIAAASMSLVLAALRTVASDKANVGTDAIAARTATSWIIEDLKLATAITEKTATSITMTVPDRNRDGSAETIRYSWSGTRGDPLLRSYNGNTAGVVLKDVQSLNFEYLTKKVGRPPPYVQADVDHVKHMASSVTSGNRWPLSSSSEAAAYFKPTLPTTATSWRITSAQVQLQQNANLLGLASLGNVVVTYRYAGADRKPTGSDLATSSITTISVLSGSPAWMTFNFSSTPDLDVTKGVCIIVSSDSSSQVAYVYYDPTTPDTSIYYMTSSDGGSTWTTPVNTVTPQFRVVGSITIQDRETLDFQALPGGPN